MSADEGTRIHVHPEPLCESQFSWGQEEPGGWGSRGSRRGRGWGRQGLLHSTGLHVFGSLEATKPLQGHPERASLPHRDEGIFLQGKDVSSSGKAGYCRKGLRTHQKNTEGISPQ